MRLLGDEQVTTGGGGYCKATTDVALGVGERLQGEAVSDREQEGGDGLGVVARLSTPSPPWRAGSRRRAAGALEELADLALDIGVAPAGAEELEEEQEEVRLVLDQVLRW